MKRKTEIFIIGLETIIVALHYAIKPPFQDDAHDHLAHFSFALGAPGWLLVVLAVGLLAFCIGIYAQKTTPIELLALVGLGMVWGVNLVALSIQSMHFGHTISLQTIFAAFIWVRVLILARRGGWR